MKELSFDEKVALDGEVALAISTATSDEEVLYKLFFLLYRIMPEARENAIRSALELVEIPEEPLQKLLSEINLRTVPKWIWYAKCIRDLKDATLFAEQDNNGNNYGGVGVLESPINREKGKKRVIVSAFVHFCRIVSTIDKYSAAELCRKILVEKELEYLAPACYSLLGQMRTLGTRKYDVLELMETHIDLREILEFKREVVFWEDADKVMRNIKSKKKLKKQLKFSEDIKNIEDDDFVVIKRFKNSGKIDVIKKFKTRREAEEFIEEIAENYPELLNTCDFAIGSKD